MPKVMVRRGADVLPVRFLHHLQPRFRATLERTHRLTDPFDEDFGARARQRVQPGLPQPPQHHRHGQPRDLGDMQHFGRSQRVQRHRVLLLHAGQEVFVVVNLQLGIVTPLEHNLSRAHVQGFFDPAEDFLLRAPVAFRVAR